jgi:3-methyladenine DNA glycosylase AlkD
MTELIEDLQRRISRHATEASRRWWTQYLRGEAQFRGVKMGDIRSTVHTWVADYNLGHALRPDERFNLVAKLVRQRHTEDKLAGILLLDEVLIPAGEINAQRDVPEIAGWFDEGHLADWNIVDWTCVKALNSLVAAEGGEAGKRILSWCHADCLWRARASVVTFANVTSAAETLFPGFRESFLAACGTVLQRPERFAKTGVGWALRGIGEVDPKRLDAFIDENLGLFSIEALRNAVKRLPADRAGALLSGFRAILSVEPNSRLA